jgi:hypothetical protein
MSKWKEIETPKGTLKYRFPNIAEGYFFLSAIKSISSAQDIFRIKGDFIEKMEPMVDYKSLNYESYDDFLNDRENNTLAMTRIADEVFIEITRTLGKKPLSQMPSAQHPQTSANQN